MVLGERQVEIPWLANFLHETKIPEHSRCLDVGSAGADYIDLLKHFNLTRLDQCSITDDTHRVITSDIRNFKEQFDVVIVLSMLEHVGLDAYGINGKVNDPVAEQRTVFDYCYSLVEPNGFLIATLPFGAYENGGWYLTYNKEMIDNLIKDKFVLEETYFTVDPSTWAYYNVLRHECPHTGQQWPKPDFSRASSVCCLALRKCDRQMYGPKVNLGSGGVNIEGFINVDLYAKNPSVINCDFVTYMSRCPSNSVKYICMSHSLEHIPLRIVPEFLKDCYRSLTKEGFLEIVCPDGLWYMDKFLTNKSDIDLINRCFYGNMNNKYDFHRWVVTEPLMRKLLSEAGFQNIKIYTGDSNIGVHCIK